MAEVSRPPPTTVSAGASDAIRDHARAAPDEEVCGCLLSVAEGRRDVREVLPGRNIASQYNRTRTYELDPLTHLRAADTGRLVGFYHSHPQGPSWPSSTDVKRMLPGHLYAIYDLAAGHLSVWLREGRRLTAVRVWPAEGRTEVNAR